MLILFLQWNCTIALQHFSLPSPLLQQTDKEALLQFLKTDYNSWLVRGLEGLLAMSTKRKPKKKTFLGRIVGSIKAAYTDYSESDSDQSDEEASPTGHQRWAASDGQLPAVVVVPEKKATSVDRKPTLRFTEVAENDQNYATEFENNFVCESYELVFAEHLGVNMEEPFAPELVSMAQVAIQHLPENWKMKIHVDETFGEIPFFVNLETNETMWNHPYEEEYRYLIAEKRQELMSCNGDGTGTGNGDGDGDGDGDAGNERVMNEERQDNQYEAFDQNNEQSLHHHNNENGFSDDYTMDFQHEDSSDRSEQPLQEEIHPTMMMNEDEDEQPHPDEIPDEIPLQPYELVFAQHIGVNIEEPFASHLLGTYTLYILIYPLYPLIHPLHRPLYAPILHS